ncbi:MAG: aldehyde dehydrogenase family protein [Candidatus Micrarchaeota archaeon]
MQKHLIYINGEWIDSDSGETFETINPATEEILAEFPKSSKEDVKRAVDAAEDAYPKWSATPAPERGKVLFKITELLRQEKQRLGLLVAKEMGKAMPEALGDVQEAIDVFEYMAAEGRRLFGHTTPSELHDKFCMTIRRPIGVVGLICPWNFPMAIPAWKLAPALICGNAVVFKPSSDTPLCAVELVKVLEKAGLPKGVVNFVTGSGSVVGEEIITNKKIYGLSFTGSKETGEKLTQKAGVKKIGLELGGKNAIIVMDDANIELAVDGTIWGAFGTTGQRCTASSRVIIHEKVKNQFEKLLKKRAEALTVGSSVDGAQVGPLINKKALEKTEKYVQIGLDEGANLLSGGKRLDRKGFFHQPTVFTDTKPNMRICQEEIFGPVVSIISINSLEQAIEVANGIEYGLSSSIYTKDMKNAFEVINKVDTGVTYINSSTIGAEVHLPFGGVKGTGNGTREAGIEGIHEFSETKAVYFDYSGKLQKAQIDNAE